MRDEKGVCIGWTPVQLFDVCTVCGDRKAISRTLIKPQLGFRESKIYKTKVEIDPTLPEEVKKKANEIKPVVITLEPEPVADKKEETKVEPELTLLTITIGTKDLKKAKSVKLGDLVKDFIYIYIGTQKDAASFYEIPTAEVKVTRADNSKAEDVTIKKSIDSGERFTVTFISQEL